MLVGFIYVVTNTVNGKLYIGKTVKPFDERWRKHLAAARNKDFYLYKSIRKHGANVFTFEVVDVAFTESELNRKEQEHIKREVTTEVRFGYNMTSGGEGGTPNEEVRARKSATNKETWTRPEVRARRAAGIKEANARPEVKARISAAVKKAFARPEVRAKLSETSKKALARPEVRAKIAAARRKYFTRPEARAKLSAVATERNARPEVKARTSAVNRNCWANPEHRKARCDAMSKRWERRFLATVAWG